MRSIWKGAISFGLVTIPVKLYSATEQKDVTFHQVHREDAGRIKYRRVCAIDGQEVTYSDIAKGYELPGGEIVVLTDEDFADLPLSTSRRIDVLQFTPAEQIDPILFNKSYYLEPENTGVKPYVLLRDALERTGQVAIVKIALRQRESLATLRIRDGVFVLETMLWPDEVRQPGFEFQDEDVEVRPQELRMAESLIETMAGDFDPSEYRDEYREALQEVIEAKVAGKELVRPEAPEEAGPAVDLMAALRASVDAAKREREGAREKAPARGKAAKAAGGEGRADQAGKAGKAEEKAEKDGKKQPAKRRTRKTA
ncbi:non-homologous end joining protein Ku [Sphaerisporangium krabiense]|uniref:Non-homologous end joining protein Ku n=1 Tax=Sphaerisporangium krabiense TaxID=763782 RepID=A0A7W9DQK0_9ACTN|nr:Ku protein [Sphaerisporangium krabiense]MBB5627561.1 DNA end-binding protein Ku [Sphaerisporangium krabiense]GII66576.1 non-homologous end joining protein Ku [Sphaerisporangium krabiense]